MKITISIELDTPTQAREVLAAIERIPTLPFRLDGFGARALDAVNPKVAVAESAGDLSESGSHVGTPEPRPNVSPGDPNIVKIGGAAKDYIMANVDIVHNVLQYQEHCKLLWKRGEIKFDGERYYL